MKVDASGANSFLEGFGLPLEIQNRPIVSNISIFLKNVDDTIHTIGLIFQVVQHF